MGNFLSHTTQLQDLAAEEDDTTAGEDAAEEDETTALDQFAHPAAARYHHYHSMLNCPSFNPNLSTGVYVNYALRLIMYYHNLTGFCANHTLRLVMSDDCVSPCDLMGKFLSHTTQLQDLAAEEDETTAKDRLSLDIGQSEWPELKMAAKPNPVQMNQS